MYFIHTIVVGFGSMLLARKLWLGNTSEAHRKSLENVLLLPAMSENNKVRDARSRRREALQMH
jgi:hypothetical protein